MQLTYCFQNIELLHLHIFFPKQLKSPKAISCQTRQNIWKPARVNFSFWWTEHGFWNVSMFTLHDFSLWNHWLGIHKSNHVKFLPKHVHSSPPFGSHIGDGLPLSYYLYISWSLDAKSYVWIFVYISQNDRILGIKVHIKCCDELYHKSWIPACINATECPIIHVQAIGNVDVYSESMCPFHLAQGPHLMR